MSQFRGLTRVRSQSERTSTSLACILVLGDCLVKSANGGGLCEYGERIKRLCHQKRYVASCLNYQVCWQLMGNKRTSQVACWDGADWEVCGVVGDLVDDIDFLGLVFGVERHLSEVVMVWIPERDITRCCPSRTTQLLSDFSESIVQYPLLTELGVVIISTTILSRRASPWYVGNITLRSFASVCGLICKAGRAHVLHMADLEASLSGLSILMKLLWICSAEPATFLAFAFSVSRKRSCNDDFGSSSVSTIACVVVLWRTRSCGRVPAEYKFSEPVRYTQQPAGVIPGM